MSVQPCIPDLLAKGLIPQKQAKSAQEAYDRHFAALRNSMSADAAMAEASERALKELENVALQKKRQTVMQVMAQRRIEVDKPGTKLYEDVEFRRRAIRSQAFARMTDVLATFRRNLMGQVRNRATLIDLAREAFGEASGNANARELAEAWGEAAELLRKRFNAAGGNIGKIDRWGLPQSHDSRLVRAAGFEQWRDTLMPLLDRARMIDDRTGLPFDDGALEMALRDVFETIRTDGWAKRTAGGQGKASLASRNAEHRFLHFKSADDWMAYAEAFGSGNPFDAMIGHVEAMSRDIAAMELLGPNPAATVNWHQDLIRKMAADDTSPGAEGVDKANAEASMIQRLWGELTGENRRPESRRLALGFSALRSLQTSAKLGGAVLSATTDLAFQAVTRRYNNLPIAGMLRDYMKLLNPASAEDRLFATRAGLIAETWAQMAGGQHRYLNEELTSETARRLAEFTLRASGLNAWTDAGRWAFGMEFLNHLTLQRELGFDQLDGTLRAAMERNGIDAARWDKIRSTPLIDHKGQGWILPSAIKDADTADALLEWILKETDYAVPTADLTTRAWMNSVAPKGTWIGEVMRSALLFKSFGISMAIQQGRRILEHQDGWSRARYAAALILGTTAMGGLALQLKEVAKGKDPRPMDDKAFWGAALLQGGGLGIYGDFLSNAENRFGGGITSTLAGPMAQTFSNVGDLTIGNIAKAARGDKTDVGKDVLKLIKQETPGSSLWYSRLAFERILLDELQTAVDPNYRQAWRRMERRAAENGQGIWWEPGESAPDRAPDLGNMFGNDGGAVAEWGEAQ